MNAFLNKIYIILKYLTKKKRNIHLVHSNHLEKTQYLKQYPEIAINPTVIVIKVLFNETELLQLSVSQAQTSCRPPKPAR